MISRVLVAALLAGASAPALAEDVDRKWTRADTALQLTFTALTAYDWAQTRTFRREHPEWAESNPVLGQYPSRAKVNTLIASAIIGHAAVSALLPRPYRTLWQALWIGVEAQAVHGNYAAGVRVKW